MLRTLAAVCVAVFVLSVASAQAADTLDVHLVSQNASVITLGWTPQPGYGYLFSVNGSLVSRTNDPSRSSVKFSKVTNGVYEVAVIVKGATGSYPPPAPPPPKNQCEDGTDNDGDGKIDYPADPGCIGLTDNDETDPPPPSGNASVFLSPTGSDSNACSQAAPCRSFQRGYEKALPGQVVEAAGGLYGNQSMRRISGRTDPNDVIIRPAPGAIVSVSGLDLGSYDVPQSGPTHLTIRDVRSSRTPQGSIGIVGVDDVTLENLDFSNFYENWSSNLTIRGGDYGPCTVPSNSCANSKLDVETGANITIDGALFHDMRIVPNSGEHFECLIVFGGQNITIRNSTFRDCEFYDIFLQHPVWAGSRFDGSSPRNILIERSTFDVTWDNGHDGRTSAIAFSPRRVPFRDVLIRCNTFLAGASISVNDDGDGTQYVNFQVIPITDPGC